MLDWLKGYKTYLAMAIAVLTAIVAFASGELNTTELALALQAATGGLFLRLGIKTEKIVTFLSGYKTYLTMAVAILTAVYGWVQGELDWLQALFAVQAAVAGIFIRKGMKEENGS